MKKETSYKVSCELTPWCDCGYDISKFYITEKLGGDVPTGSIDLVYSNNADLTLLTEGTTGTIKIEDTNSGGKILEIPIFITTRGFYRNTLSLSFICIPDKKFFIEVLEGSYLDAGKAFSEGLYPGDTWIESESDLPSGLKIYQFGETAYKVCNRLGLAYRKGSVFGYSWSGLVIKDLKTGGESIPRVSGADMKMITPYGLEYNKLLLHNPYNPWESEISYNESSSPQEETISNPVEINTTPELGVVRYYEQYCLIREEYRPLLENYLYNKDILKTDATYTIGIKGAQIPGYSLGDSIEYIIPESDNESLELPYTRYYVYSNELFISMTGAVDPSGLNLSWTTVLRGLDNSGSWAK